MVEDEVHHENWVERLSLHTLWSNIQQPTIRKHRSKQWHSYFVQFKLVEFSHMWKNVFLAQTLPQHSKTLECTVSHTWISFACILHHQSNHWWLFASPANFDHSYFDQCWQIDLENFLRQCRLCSHGKAFGEKLFCALPNDRCLVCQNSDCQFWHLLEICLRLQIQVQYEHCNIQLYTYTRICCIACFT